ncbi:zinc finger CCCH domain-containing protein 34 isoform X2 [Ziziphus jujuba]|uniref:Zinc finger CCCH domain-containing protein 34 isoform X2 n=1 Tax=Ziziphus jujuba TaxID=326968 RepID=A0ABM3I5Y9_ZIZJJ|nr:zinc finger CCCH domain-containing protein 34 isoform X2 [Ziziphus jujuba]
MERYGRATTEGSQSDPSPEWTAPVADTGLEEPVWQLGVGGEESYPERPNENDCIYYLKTGYCGYGSRCRYNHPRDRSAVMGAARAGGVEYPERVGQPVCQGEKECSYYVKTGQCKFGTTCKFHHPLQAGVQLPAPSPTPQVQPVPAPTLYPPVQSPSGSSSQQYGLVVARPPLIQGPYVQSPYGTVLIPPGMVQFPSWNPYTASVSPLPSPSTQPTVGSGPIYGITQLSPSASAYTGSYQPPLPSVGPSSGTQKERLFPERPGQQECQYYLKTGDCKYGSSCRYHHPPEVIAPKATVVLSPMGLPMRPGAPLCTHYAQRGVCKFGPACKFDHPMESLSYSPSASSLTDMPVAPYPVGSSIGTLAPSSSSSELRPELTSGSSKDSTSARMSSSMSTTSGSVGSTFSKGGSVSHLSLQQSAQSSGPSTGSNSSISESHTSS